MESCVGLGCMRLLGINIILFHAYIKQQKRVKIIIAIIHIYKTLLLFFQGHLTKSNKPN